MKNTSKSKEKRYGLRLRAEDLFLVEFRIGKTITSTKGFGCDLSLSGAQFTTLIPFQKEEAIRMIIRFSPQYLGPRSVELSGQVIRSSRPAKSYYSRIACKFLEDQKEEQKILETFMNWLQSLTGASSEPLISCRRAALRIQARDTFQMEFKKGGRKILNTGYGCDLSPLGASFTTIAPLRKQEKLEATLHFSPEFPGPKSLELEAEVVHIDSSTRSAYTRVACKFHDQKGLAQWIIRQFLEWLNKKGTS